MQFVYFVYMKVQFKHMPCINKVIKVNYNDYIKY